MQQGSNPEEREAKVTGLNRRGFLQSSAGVAGGVAVTLTPSAAALALAGSAEAAPAKVVTHRSGQVPSEPVMAYVHDEERGEVTVLSGTSETTYRDPALAKRLLDAARRQST